LIIVRNVIFRTQSWPIKGRIAISRGSRTETNVIICEITDENGAKGRGECVPYALYDENIESVLGQLQETAPAIEDEADRMSLYALLPAGAARNALDCALWDLEAKQTGKRVESMICDGPAQPLETAYTISMDTPEVMADACRKVADRPLLKIKVGGENDAARIHATAIAAPNARIIVDANEGWCAANIAENLEAAARAGIALIEQPLPAGEDTMLQNLPHHVPICADESVHTIEDLKRLDGLYDAVNIKLDKTGGLSEAIKLRDAARQKGFATMIGCMVAASLAMAPAVLLAQGADFVDLDGPLLLAEDCKNGLQYEESLVYPPKPELWG
jgi:L-alanine-DL-glutamate epimerase-like enolase superfamily enzyme